MKRTKVIAIEGIDGSGKGVQYKLLADNLVRLGYTVETRSFPEYDSFFGSEAGRLLAGNDGARASDIEGRTMALWFALDRWESFADWKDGESDFLIINRYVLSNAVYQSTRDIDIGKQDIVDWVFELEFGHFRLPRPDVMLFFDVSASSAEKLVEKKGYRDYVGDGKDVYEQSNGLQDRARTKYLECADRMDDVAVIQCMDGERLKSAEEIADDVMRCLGARNIIH